MIYSQILLLFLLISPANAFFARLITDPIQSCQKTEDPDGLEKYNCIESSRTSVSLESLGKVSDDLQKSIVQNYEDLNAATLISRKIISQTLSGISKYKRIKKEIETGKVFPSEQEISDGINLLANLEYKIQLVEKRNNCVGRTNSNKNAKRLKKCKEKRDDELTPLLMSKALLISANPILGNKNITELITSKVDRVNSDYIKASSKIINCHRNNRRPGKKKKCNDSNELYKKKSSEELNFSRNDYLGAVEKAVKNSIESSLNLKKRHSEVIEDIEQFNSRKRSPQEMNTLRDSIFHDRDISTDYYVSSAFTRDKEINEGVRCRLIGEYNANENNSLINSIALDIAVMAIPIGGPLIMARTLSRVAKMSKGLQKFFTAKKIATTAKIGTVRYELTAMGFDLKNLYDEKDHCEEVISKAEALGEISKELTQSYERCKSTLNNMTMSLVAASMGGALGTFSMKKFLPKSIQPKSVLGLKSETNLSVSEISEFSRLKDGNTFPLLGKADMETLTLTPKDATIDVEIRTMFSSDKKTFTPEQFLEFAQKNELDSARIVKVNYDKSFSNKELALSNSKFTESSLERISESPDGKLSYIVEYQSGELGSYSGSSSMIRDLSLRDDIVSINHSFSIPRSIESGHRIPASRRDSSFKLVDDIFSKVGEDAQYTISQKSGGDLADIKLYHGTIKEMEGSVRGGPKNLGKGFGGRGLYLDISDDAHIAKEYSIHAQAAAQNRLSNISDNAVEAVKNADTTSIVMTGKLNLGKKKLKVGKFTIVRSGEVDLEKGILPANWDEDPRLVKMMEQKFHILDLRGMKSNGLNLDTDRILIIHENAGKNIVKWEDGVE